MTRTDVLVVGGGIVGLVAAVELAEAGATVEIVDSQQNAGSNTNAGSLHVQMQSRFIRLYPDQAPNVEACLPVYKRAAELWQEMEDRLGPMDLVCKGGLMLAESDEQMAFLERKARREEARGLNVAMLDRKQLEAVAPWIGPQIVGAELCRDEGKLDPLLANSRLISRCTELGVERLTDRIATLEEDGARVMAHGHDGTRTASQVLIAAAWGSGDIVAGFGVDIPTRAEPLHMNITEPCDQRIETLVQHAERSITLKQFRSGQVVVGGGWPALDCGPDSVPNVKASSLIGNVGLAAKLVPAIGSLRIIRTWAGMNTTVDGVSIIGPVPGTKRVTMAVPGDAGYTLGPLVAQAAAAVILGRIPEIDIAPFDPARFAPLSV